MKLFVLALILISAVAFAGVQQGEDLRDLHSPMVLTGAFPLANPDTWGTYGTFGESKYTDPSIYSDFYRYHCDGLAITELRLRGAPDGEVLRVHLRGKIDAAMAGHDKAYTFQIELLNGDETVFVTEDGSKIPDKDHSRFDFSFAVPKAMLKVSPETTMRITMRTKDY